jgi:hypothetical protein
VIETAGSDETSSLQRAARPAAHCSLGRIRAAAPIPSGGARCSIAREAALRRVIGASGIMCHGPHLRTDFRQGLALPLIEVPATGYMGRSVPPVARRTPPTRRITTAGTGGAFGGNRTFILSR